MISPIKRIKDQLRPLPGVQWAYVNLMTLIAYAKYRIMIDDECRLKDTWDFELPSERQRHRIALEVVEAQTNAGDWGEVLEVGCNTGVFTVQLANRARLVTACDVSEASCQMAAKRCFHLQNVEVQTSNILTDPITRKYDVVFIMGTLCYFKGSTRLSRVATKLSGALREGGILVIQEMRLDPEVEASAWARWLGEGGLQIRDFFCRRGDLHLVCERLDPLYITLVYEKVQQVPVATGWKSLVPEAVKSGYRKLRVFREFARDLHGVISVHQRVRELKTILKVYRDSLISVTGLKQLHQLALELDEAGVAGDFVECGVYRGGSAAVLGSTLGHSPFDRSLWLFDSFEGLPPAEAIDGPSAATMKQKLVGDEQNLRRLLNEVGVPKTKAHVCAGWFSETFPRAPIKRIALLHIDADWYASVKECLENFYDRVEPGGAVVLDDYGEWPGCKAALDDFAAARSLNIQLEGGKETPFFFRKTR